jgi:hypothetical protein
MFNLNSKEVIRLQAMNEALRQQKMGLQSEKNKLEIQKNEVIEMINKYDYFNDNIYTLLREIQKKLNS